MFVFIVSNGQASNDTVFFSGQPFVKHVVDTGQSLSKIAKIYNVTTDQIKNSMSCVPGIRVLDDEEDDLANNNRN